MNRRSLLKLGLLAPLAPEALATAPTVTRTAPIAMSVGEPRFALTVVAIDRARGSVTFDWAPWVPPTEPTGVFSSGDAA
jgi:hypothetical protein